jgi:glycerol-3-phosphate acyltransferase PlsY
MIDPTGGQMNIWAAIPISIILAYFLGSFLPSYFIARIKGFDIRNKGTGNPGISNTARTMGYGYGVIVALYDLFKAPLAIFISSSIGAPSAVAFLAGFITIIGHMFPFYLNFKGGKGWACCVGIMVYSTVSLLMESWQLVFVLLPILATSALFIIFVIKENGIYRNMIIFGLLPLYIVGTILYSGVNIFTVSLLLASCIPIGQNIFEELNEKIKKMTDEERSLLRRKWLRPLAIVFPIGVIFFKTHTLILLGIVLLFFAILEVLRFTSGIRKFPLSYKKTERRKISSIGMFLFATFLTLVIFPKNVASLAVMFTIYGDLLAWCVGYGIGGPGFLGKTWIGAVACFMTCIIITSIYVELGLIPLIAGFAGAFTAAVIEFAPIREDNFSIPITSAIIMTMLIM